MSAPAADSETTVTLRADEAAYLTGPTIVGAPGARCGTCGHLQALHNTHCCVFCMVGDCKCWEGEMDE